MPLHLSDDESSALRQRIAEAILRTDAPEWHLEPELIMAMADGTAGAIDRDIAEPHLADCMQCRREVRDLETFARKTEAAEATASTLNQKAGPGGTQVWGRSLRPPLYAAAAAVILAVLLVPMFRQSNAPATSLTLVDRGRQLSVMSDGRLLGLGLDADAESRLSAALTHGVIAEPTRIAALRHETESLRGATSPGTLAPILPIGCVVVTRQPTFEWTAVPGARYKIEVFGDEFRPVAQSELLDANRWTVPQPLAHGEIYAWQVTAYKPNGEATTSPAPPNPEARFAVIDVNEAARIDQLQQMQPPSHLALGVAYAEAGAAAEAERELAALTVENRGSEPAARLLRAIRARR